MVYNGWAIIENEIMSWTFSSFPSSRQAVSSGTLSALIQLQRQDLLTGLIDVAYAGGSQTLLFFNVGTPFAMFFRNEESWRKVPSSQWTEHYARPAGEAAIVPLSGDTLRLSLLALEAGTVQTEAIQLRPSRLIDHLEELRARNAVDLLWVKNGALQGLLLTPGWDVPLRDACIFTARGVQTAADAIARLSEMDDQLLQISQFEYPQLPGFLNEYALRVAFLSLIGPSFRRFEQLAGNTLTEALGQEINRYALHQGWKIQVYGDQVQHRQFFEGVSEATTVYRGLFRAIRNYTQRVVGATLSASVVSEGIKSLPAAYREIFERQNFLTG
jgi:hypothetical protein